MREASKVHFCLFNTHLSAVLLVLSDYNLRDAESTFSLVLKLSRKRGKSLALTFPQNRRNIKVGMSQGRCKCPHPSRKVQVKDGEFEPPVAWLIVLVMFLETARSILIHVFYEPIMLNT